MSMNRLRYPMLKFTLARKPGFMNCQGQARFVRNATRIVCVIVTTVAIAMSVVDRSAMAQASSEAKSDESKPESERLPGGYQAPPERLAIMDLDRPLLDKDEMAKLKKEAVNKFAMVKQNCDLSPNGKKVIEGAIRYKLAEMTIKDEQSKLPRLHQAFLGEISKIGDNTKKASEIQDMSKQIGQEVLKRMPELLKNNFYVRLHAVEILGEMDFSPASEVLINVLQSNDITADEENGQPEAIKISAVNSLIRILRFAGPTAKERGLIAAAIISELRKSDAFWWRQVRMIEAIRYCDISGVDVGDKDRPFVVETLLSIAKDSERPWKVRTRACYALGRVPIPKSVRIDDVVTAVCECGLQLSNAAAANPRDLNWKKCFANLYFAFQTGGKEKDKDMDAERRMPGGLLSRASAAAKPAYQVLLPIFNDVRISGDDIYIAKPPSAENIRKLTDFVKSRNSGAGA